LALNVKAEEGLAKADVDAGRAGCLLFLGDGEDIIWISGLLSFDASACTSGLSIFRRYRYGLQLAKSVRGIVRHLCLPLRPDPRDSH
jgi:hypothetical protein